MAGGMCNQCEVYECENVIFNFMLDFQSQLKGKDKQQMYGYVRVH